MTKLWMAVLAGILAVQAQGAIDWVRDADCQLVFHAVLEGLYADGVANEHVDLIVPRTQVVDASGRVTEVPNMRTHFVYACPLCHPVYEAFLLYRARSEAFYGRKDAKGSFGAGLDAATVEKLKSPVLTTRLDAIQALIARWVDRRVSSLRLTPAEREAWRNKIAGLAKEGEAMLSKQADDYKDWKKCSICRGSVDGAMPTRGLSKP